MAAEKDSGESKDEGKKSDLNIGVFYYTYADTFISLLYVQLFDKKLDDMGVKYQDYDGNNNQTTQNEQIGYSYPDRCKPSDR